MKKNASQVYTESASFPVVLDDSESRDKTDKKSTRRKEKQKARHPPTPLSWFLLLGTGRPRSLLPNPPLSLSVSVSVLLSLCSSALSTPFSLPPQQAASSWSSA